MLIAADLIYRDGALDPGLAVRVRDGRLDGPPFALGHRQPDMRVALIAPGLCDLQVNGGGGAMVNTDPTPAGLRQIRDAHRRLGTATIMPTVITDAPEVLEAAADTVIACRDEPGLLGLHIEGPHIAGARAGTHDPSHIRPLDAQTMQVLARLRKADIPVILTLAPEVCDPALMQQAAQMGVTLSAGHSQATSTQTHQAMRDGVTMFTHLFNAMPPMLSRAPNITNAAILSNAWVGMIADGIHVDWDMLRLALAARPLNDRSFLVSDAMPTVGGPDSFSLYGQTITVKDGRLINAQGNLAGAHVCLLECVLRLHRHAGVGLAQALSMASDVPRRALGLAPVTLASGLGLDMVLALDRDMAPVTLSD